MSAPRRALSRLFAMFRKRELDHDLDEELAAHLEFAIADNMREGMSRDEATRTAKIEMGGLEQTRELHRDSRGLPFVEAVTQDLRYTLRMFRRFSGLTTFAILIVGLGIGASATVFSVVNAMLLRPLPFAEPERLIWIENDLGPTQSHKTIQVGHLENVREQCRSVSDVAGYFAFGRPGDYTIGAPADPLRLTGKRVTENFFDLLGVHPEFGRGFTPDEVRLESNVVLFSHGLWQRRFGADPSIVGSAVTIDGKPVTVIGVLPASFDFANIFEPGNPTDLFFPFPLDPSTHRWGNTMFLVARLSPDVTVDAARAEIGSLATGSSPPEGYNNFAPRVLELRERVSGPYRSAMFVLVGAVALVMLIVCANLSNLLLSRDATRDREFAVRASLGAGRGRLVQQMLTESVALSFVGAALGLLLAYFGTHLLAGLEAVEIPLRDRVGLDGTALGFTVLIALVTGIGFGVVPALRLSAVSPLDPLKDSGRGMSSGKRQRTFRAVLVVTEVALACVLLVGAGLLMRSFMQVLDVDLGFQPSRAVTMRVDPGRTYERDARMPFLDDALRRIRDSPAVEAAGLADALPLGVNRQWQVADVTKDYPADTLPLAYVHVVSEGYLDAVGAALAEGRDFTSHDDREHPPVVLINETLASRFWPEGSAVGRMLKVDVPREVVGVVGDVRHLGVERAADADFYIPMRQSRAYRAAHLVVRGNRAPRDLAAVARDAILAIDPRQPVREFRVLQDIVDRAVSPRRFIVALLGGFAVFAVILASLGIYGVISFGVSQRRQEIGIRVALGATVSGLQRRVLMSSLRLAAVGMGIGVVASWFVVRLLHGLLFGVTPWDPATFLGTVLVLTIVSALAGYLPARRVSRMDPVAALRGD